ncbi:MAG: hypothetical protein ACYC6N_31605, partial [Pirellulaceae bacterium]
TSLDVLVNWVKRHGLPEPPPPRWTLEEAMDVVARPYNESLWHEGKGWGRTVDQTSLILPGHLQRYLAQYADRPVAQALGEKWGWAREQLASQGIEVEPNVTGRRPLPSRDEALKRGRELMALQRPDGSFGFDPHGRHQQEHHLVAAALWKPLGREGDTGVDLNVDPARELLLIAEATGEAEFKHASRKALDFCLALERPDAGDWWETPLGSPNLLAAGNAAIAYYLGYEAFGDSRYLERSRYWLRCLLAFTHLWEPAELHLLYNTKPCLNQSIWLATWTDADVQWEVLNVFAQSSDLGIDWTQVDPEIDWHRYQQGITVAALRWMVDHTDATHQTHPGDEADNVRRGFVDGYFYDVCDVVSANYAGALIESSPIMRNIFALLDRDREKAQ